MAFGEKIHTWRRAGFILELWDTHRPTGSGRLAHTLLAYRFSDRGRTIFAGDRFSPPLSVSIDSDECVIALLRWFTLQPGDVEDDYFEGYTPAQHEWMESRAGDLTAIVWSMECEEEQGAG
jgi:hypothetical protein